MKKLIYSPLKKKKKCARPVRKARVMTAAKSRTQSPECSEDKWAEEEEEGGPDISSPS